MPVQSVQKRWFLLRVTTSDIDPYLRQDVQIQLDGDVGVKILLGREVQFSVVDERRRTETEKAVGTLVLYEWTITELEGLSAWACRTG